MYELIIIGGGPAGLTAGLYASRARLKTLLMESFSLSSQILLGDTIENYPGFPDGIKTFDLIDRFKKQTQAFGLEIVAEEVQNIKAKKEENFKLWQVVTQQKEYTARAIIIAAGAKPKRLNITGEEEFLGRGVSYCATCDGAFYKGKNIVAVGGGDTAIEETLHLTKFADKVTLIHRRDRLRATKILQERVSTDKKIELVFNSQVIEIAGEDKVKAVKLKNAKTEKETIISCDGVFIFAGLLPNTDFLKGLVALDEKGYIVTGVDMETQAKGIFACGDCRKKLLFQVVTACGDGATAAFSATQYIEDLKG
ncbi:thioredoxin-disulfide reductase, partial [bacterium]|nr:thioredoxin-disulfide reductase [bacterium]